MTEQASQVEQPIPLEHSPLSPVDRVKDAVVGFLKSRLPGEKTKRGMELVDTLTRHLPEEHQELATKLRPIIQKGMYAGNVVGTTAEAVLVAAVALGGALVVKEVFQKIPNGSIPSRPKKEPVIVPHIDAEETDLMQFRRKMMLRPWNTPPMASPPRIPGNVRIINHISSEGAYGKIYAAVYDTTRGTRNVVVKLPQDHATDMVLKEANFLLENADIITSGKLTDLRIPLPNWKFVVKPIKPIRAPMLLSQADDKPIVVTELATPFRLSTYGSLLDQDLPEVFGLSTILAYASWLLQLKEKTGMFCDSNAEDLVIELSHPTKTLTITKLDLTPSDNEVGVTNALKGLLMIWGRTMADVFPYFKYLESLQHTTVHNIVNEMKDFVAQQPWDIKRYLINKPFYHAWTENDLDPFTKTP